MNISRNSDRYIGQDFIELGSVGSTNNYAMEQVHAGLAFHGTIYFAYEQSAGKGQRGKSWTSSPGQNITMSIVLKPEFLQPVQQFILSVTIALACYDFLKKYTIKGWSIKWPNDIYWNDRKAGGILIESICKGNEWLFAICGIGININQIEFPDYIPNAISLRQITGKKFSTSELAKELGHFIDKKYKELKEKGVAKLLSQYNSLLYKRNQTVKLKKGNIVFETIIKEVTPLGQLITYDTLDKSFDLGEVEWVI